MIREKKLLVIEAKKGRSKLSPSQLADEILKELSPDLGRHFPADFLQPGWEMEIVALPVESDHCRQALTCYQQSHEQLHVELLERAGQKTADARLQARVVKLVEARLAEKL